MINALFNQNYQNRHFCPQLQNVQQLNKFILWISNQETCYSTFSIIACIMHFFKPKTRIFDPNLKTPNTYRLASSGFAFIACFSLETLKISSAYTLKQAKGLKWENSTRLRANSPQQIYMREASKQRNALCNCLFRDAFTLCYTGYEHFFIRLAITRLFAVYKR